MDETTNRESSILPVDDILNAPGDAATNAAGDRSALVPAAMIAEAPVDVVAPAPTSTEYLDLVAERLGYYRDFTTHLTPIDDPRISPGQRVRIARRTKWARRIASTPARAAIAGATGTAACAALDWWGLIVGVTVGVGSSVVADRSAKNAPALTRTISTEAARAVTDYRDALDALLATASDSRSYVSVGWFESKVGEHLLALTSGTVTGADYRKVADELCEIGARSWALAQLEARRAAVTEASVSAVTEALDETPDGPDFTELDAVASTVAVDTVEVARVMGVDLPALTTPPVARPSGPSRTTSEIECSHCGVADFTLRGDTALCQSCGNYWTTQTQTAVTRSALYCTGSGDLDCGCSSCLADDATWGDDSTSSPSCSPCNAPISPGHEYKHAACESASLTEQRRHHLRVLIGAGLDVSDESKRCRTCRGTGESSRGAPGGCRNCRATGWRRDSPQHKAIMADALATVDAMMDDDDDDDWF